MRLTHFLLVFFLFIGNTFGYECKSRDILKKIPNDKKSSFHLFSKKQRSELMSTLIYLLTEKDIPTGDRFQDAFWLSEYLENTEQNENYRAFFKLLRISSDLESKKPKKINLKEVCEMIEKINSLSK